MKGAAAPAALLLPGADEGSRRVSVVIPTLNRAAMLREALASVAAQTRPVLETIVIDDGSTEDIASVASEFAGVQLLRTERVGPAAARNAGFAAARGDFVAFLDSDDVWLPRKIERQLQRFGEFPEAGLVHTGYGNWDGVNHPQGVAMSGLVPRCEGWVYPELVMRNRVGCSTVLVRSDCLRSVGGFVCDPRQSMSLDYPVWLKLARRYQFAFVPEILVYYRIHPGQVIRNGPAFEHSVGLILREIFTDPDMPLEVMKMRRRRMAQYRSDVAHAYYSEKRFWRAMLNAARAFCWFPSKAAPLAIAAKAAARGLLRSVGISVARGDAAGV